VKSIAEHIIDISQNSIDAGATNIQITLTIALNNLILKIKDNGKGIKQEDLSKIEDPFFTTKKTRKIGLGIPLLIHNSNAAEGSVVIQSEIGVGTEITATMNPNAIDMIPMGNIADAISWLISNNSKINIQFSYNEKESNFSISTSEIMSQQNELSI